MCNKLYVVHGLLSTETPRALVNYGTGNSREKSPSPKYRNRNPLKVAMDQFLRYSDERKPVNSFQDAVSACSL